MKHQEDYILQVDNVKLTTVATLEKLTFRVLVLRPNTEPKNKNSNNNIGQQL